MLLKLAPGELGLAFYSVVVTLKSYDLLIIYGVIFSHRSTAKSCGYLFTPVSW